MMMMITMGRYSNTAATHYGREEKMWYDFSPLQCMSCLRSRELFAENIGYSHLFYLNSIVISEWPKYLASMIFDNLLSFQQVVSFVQSVCSVNLRCAQLNGYLVRTISQHMNNVNNEFIFFSTWLKLYSSIFSTVMVCLPNWSWLWQRIFTDEAVLNAWSTYNLWIDSLDDLSLPSVMIWLKLGSFVGGGDNMGMGKGCARVMRYRNDMQSHRMQFLKTALVFNPLNFTNKLMK